MVRLKRERAVVAFQGLVVPLHLFQHRAAITERLYEIRPQRKRAIVAGKRRVVAAPRGMDDGHEIQSGRGARIGRQYLEAHLLGLGELSRRVAFQGDIEDLGYRQ